MVELLQNLHMNLLMYKEHCENFEIFERPMNIFGLVLPFPNPSDGPYI